MLSKLLLLLITTAVWCGAIANVAAPTFTTAVTTLAGKLGVIGSTDGIGGAARMQDPFDMAYDQRTNKLWFAGASNARIRNVALPSRQVTTVIGAAGGDANGPYAGAGILSPYMTYMPSPTSCEMFISSPSVVLRRVDFSRSAVFPVVGGIAGYAEGTGSAAKFNYITSTAMLPGDQRTLHICDRHNHVLRAVDLVTMTTRLMSGTPQAAGYQEGTSSKFSQPWGMRIRPDNATMWLSDFGNQVIRIYNPATKSTSLFAGVPGSAGNVDGVLLAARFTSPCPVRHHGDVVYVGQNHPAIRAIVNGYVISVTSSTAGAADGSFSTARFRNTHFMEIDCDGNLYSDDYPNDAIRKVVVTWPSSVTLGPVAFCTPAGQVLPPCWSTTPSETTSRSLTPADTATPSPTHSASTSRSLSPSDPTPSITGTPPRTLSNSSSSTRSPPLTGTRRRSPSTSPSPSNTTGPTMTKGTTSTQSRTNTMDHQATQTETLFDVASSSSASSGSSLGSSLSTHGSSDKSSKSRQSSGTSSTGRPTSSSSSRQDSSLASSRSSISRASSASPKSSQSTASRLGSSMSSAAVSTTSSARSGGSGSKVSMASMPSSLSSGSTSGHNRLAAAANDDSPFASSAAGIALFVAIGVTLLLLLAALVLFLLWRRRRADRRAQAELGEEAGQALVPTRGAKYTWKDEAKKVLGDIQATGAHNQRDAGDGAESVSSLEDVLHMHTKTARTSSPPPAIPPTTSAGGTLGLGLGVASPTSALAPSPTAGLGSPPPRRQMTTNPFDAAPPGPGKGDALDDVLGLSGPAEKESLAQLLSDDFNDDDL